MRNVFLWSNFPRVWFRDLRFRTWGIEINHLNAHNFLWQGCFYFSLLSREFDDRLSSNFHMFDILCIYWDTSTENAILWQLPIVSTAFNPPPYQRKLTRQISVVWGHYVQLVKLFNYFTTMSLFTGMWVLYYTFIWVCLLIEND